MTDHPPEKELVDRIRELGDKSTQLLLFLSFAMLGAVTLKPMVAEGSQTLVLKAMWWWILAVFPVLLGVLPLKEFGWQKRGWYRFVRGLKVVGLWCAVVFSVVGEVYLLLAL